MPLHIPQLKPFGISNKAGFLSDHPPAATFSDRYYSNWDHLISRLPELLSSKTLRPEIGKLQLLTTSKLSAEVEHHRAYVVLGFLIHAYVWGGSDEDPLEMIPPQLAQPFLEVCEHIGMKPVLSYAGLCLWNWKGRQGAVVGGSGDFYELHQLESIASFTGTRGEDAFYHVPVLVEAEGGPLVSCLLGAIAATAEDDASSVCELLATASATTRSMGKHLPKLYSTLDAHAFYHEMRPFLARGKGMEGKGLPRGMVFQKSDGSQVNVQCIGGSAAQSSLFHFLDYVLGIDHKEPMDGSKSVFREMREYMPGKHREFLNEVSKLPNLRSFVEKHASNDRLRQSYDGCVKELQSWRSKHIAVVSKYIVQPARLAAAKAEPELVVNVKTDAIEGTENDELRGTAGSALIPFLRQARDETAGVAANKDGEEDGLS